MNEIDIEYIKRECRRIVNISDNKSSNIRSNKCRDIIEYTTNRIYSIGEQNIMRYYYMGERKKSEEEEELIYNNKIRECIERFEELLRDSNYNICNDLDNNNNNVLHLIAENGLYELYEIIKKNENFDRMKNMTNLDNMTPLDIAIIIPIKIKTLISCIIGNQEGIITYRAMKPYLSKSVNKLIKEMTIDNLLTNGTLKYKIILYLSKYKMQEHINVILNEIINNEDINNWLNLNYNIYDI